MAMTDGAVIDIRGIGKAYGQGRTEPAWALRDVTLRLDTGAVLGLLGPNGAGKTTLIKILAGLLRPDTGAGCVLGYDLLCQPAEVRARVSLVAPTADVGIDNNLTVRQNLAFWAPIYGLRGAAARTRIDELLGQLELTEKADFWPMHISAGQRQRLALARSLLARNRLVFLDEPTNKLDLDGVRSVRKMIAELNSAYGVTIVLTTHVMEEAEELCGEIALLREGKLVAHQPTAALTQSLGLTRPVTVAVRSSPGPERSGQLHAEAGVLTALGRLPGVARVEATDAAPAGMPAEDGVTTFALHSTDLRATTPALLRFLRDAGLPLVSMRAQPVTLTDVFRALAADGPLRIGAETETGASSKASSKATESASG